MQEMDRNYIKKETDKGKKTRKEKRQGEEKRRKEETGHWSFCFSSWAGRSRWHVRRARGQRSYTTEGQFIISQ